MTPALSRSLDPLRFRPMLWMALVAICGVAAGGAWANWIGAFDRSDSRLLWPMWLTLICAVEAWHWRTHGFGRRLGVAGVLFFVFAAYAAHRIVPPQDDISVLTARTTHAYGPINPIDVTLRGIVTDYPKTGDFSIQFPLQCGQPRQGRVWVTAPYGTPLQIGDEVSLRLQLVSLPRPGNPGESASFWRFIGASCWCQGRKVTKVEKMGVSSGFAFARAIGRMREALLARYQRSFEGNGSSLGLRPYPNAMAQLLTAMVFGEGGLSQPLPQVWSDDFRRAGMTHLLVASGSQVSLLLGAILYLSRSTNLRRAPFLLIVPVLIFYSLLVGGAASIWRAALGGILATWALLLGRDADALSLWGAAILVLLCLDPLNAWSLSFQLTFAATWGLITLAPPFLRFLTSYFGKSTALELASLSLGAQAATLPITLFHFGTFSMAGMGANLVAVPLASLMILTGMLGLLWSPFNIVNVTNYYLARGVASLAHIFALLPGAQFNSSPPSMGWVWAFYALLFIAATPFSLDWKPLWEEGKQWLQNKAQWVLALLRPWPLLVVLSLFALWLCWLQWGPGNPDLRVTMLDVGQGESILIRDPSGRNVLIDGGSLDAQQRSDIGAQVLVPTLQSLGVDHLDMLVLTHADADHCNGLAAVAREIPIDNFLDGPSAVSLVPNPAEADYFQLKKQIAARAIPDVAPLEGQTFDLGGAKITILAPSRPLLQSDNNNCIVLRLDFGANSFLFTGDIEKEAEDRLLEHGQSLKCTVLKVGHHGSKSSTTPAFLNAVNPKVALISCGRYNRFGHPDGSVLQRLNKARVEVFRTDMDGAIEVDCNLTDCHATSFR